MSSGGDGEAGCGAVRCSPGGGGDVLESLRVGSCDDTGGARGCVQEGGRRKEGTARLERIRRARLAARLESLAAFRIGCMQLPGTLQYVRPSPAVARDGKGAREHLHLVSDRRYRVHRMALAHSAVVVDA